MQMIFDGPEDASVTLLLAHGAGAPMDSPSMTASTKVLAAAGLRVVRFEFAYMAARRSGNRKPPPRADTLCPEFYSAIDAIGPTESLIIGGKSMGGRVASLIADDAYRSEKICGLLCLGYPFHPPAKPAQLRTAHLEHLETPTLIVQGTRDEFGTPADVQTYRLSSQIEMLWLEDGDHDLKPRKSVSGFSPADHLKTMAEVVRGWSDRLTGRQAGP